MEALVIRLQPTTSETKENAASQAGATHPSDVWAEWLSVDGSGTRHGNVQTGTLDIASGLAGGRKLIAIVPGTDVLLAEPVLPLKSGVKLQQIVPFALEEQMAADVEDLHFAIGRRNERPGTPVAVVSRRANGDVAKRAQLRRSARRCHLS